VRRSSLVAVLAAALACGLPDAARAAPTTAASAGDARALVSGNTVKLSNGRIARTWTIDGQGHVFTVSLRDPAHAREWSNARSPDFSLELGGVPTSSASGWQLQSVAARRTPFDPARPRAGASVQVVFHYGAPTALAAAVTLERVVTLYPGSAVMSIDSTLVNRVGAAARVGAYSLDELTSPQRPSAEVHAYNGGSDWRDDYRHVSHPSGSFDTEGEVARFDAGAGAGWFFVSERRGGAMHRAGRDASGRTWIGVDPARDTFDFGPLRTDPPGYNRLENPAYPVPVRQRTVPPGGSLRLGRAYLGVWSGDPQSAAAAFADDFAAHQEPRFARSVGVNSFHPWNHGPGLSDRNLRAQVDVAKKLGVESYMLDDQWQGGPGGESGDWRFDTGRFPFVDDHGPTPEWVEYLHSKHLKLGLWLSPVEFNGASQTYAAHRDWACLPAGDVTAQVPDDAGLGVWDVTNPGFRAYLTGVIDRLIRDHKVTEFKFDFQTWLDCPPHDYLDYEDAFVSLVRSFEARHPSVTFELDETNDQRAWAFESAALGPSWFDNGHLHGSTAPAKLLHDVWSVAPWIPPSTVGFGTYDGTLKRPYTVDYLFPMSLLGHVTFWTDLRKLTRAQVRETAWWIRWYRRHRAALGGAVYENIAADPLGGRSWAAFQPWTGGRGYLFAFRQAGGPSALRIALHGLVPGVRYAIRNVRTGRLVARGSGGRLAGGLRVTLARPYSAAVLSIVPERRRPR
jgi:hypothetical protein